MALPNYRLEVVKRYANTDWSNVWLLNCLDLNEAKAVALAIANFEKQIHFSVVLVDYYVISTMVKDGRKFWHLSYNQQGVILPGTAHALPLWDTLRIDMPTADGDPARKYLRLPLMEYQQNNGVIEASTVTDYQAVVTAHLINSIALDNIVTTNGRVVTGAVVHNRVQMRQLDRRRRKKDETP